MQPIPPTHYHGALCKNCHGTERYTRSRKCVACVAVRDAAYYEANKEKIAAKYAAYREERAAATRGRYRRKKQLAALLEFTGIRLELMARLARLKQQDAIAAAAARRRERDKRKKDQDPGGEGALGVHGLQ